MRQLIARIDDDLHARLKDVARRRGHSVNAVVVEALERVVATPVDARAAVRRRARDRNLVVAPARPGVVVARETVIAETRGAGSVVGEALAAERDSR